MIIVADRIILTTVLSLVLVQACQPAYTSYDGGLKKDIRLIDYQDGISKKEAATLANSYLLIHGRYKERALFARMSASENYWVGKVYALKSAASLIELDLPPVLVNKTTGEIRWQFGPTLSRIDLEELDAAKPSRATY